MLSPKRTKFRKQQRGRMCGAATRGNEVDFGEFAMQALEPCWITSRQIESARRAMSRYIKRGGQNLDSHISRQTSHQTRRRDADGFR